MSVQEGLGWRVERELVLRSVNAESSNHCNVIASMSIETMTQTIIL